MYISDIRKNYTEMKVDEVEINGSIGEKGKNGGYREIWLIGANPHIIN